jgi:hypothetical protein
MKDLGDKWYAIIESFIIIKIKNGFQKTEIKK